MFTEMDVSLIGLMCLIITRMVMILHALILLVLLLLLLLILLQTQRHYFLTKFSLRDRF